MRQKRWADRRFRVAGGIVMVILLLAATAWALPIWDGFEIASESEERTSEARALPVQVTVVDRVEQYRVPREFAGMVRARQATSIGFEVSGRIAAVDIDEGQLVEANEQLASLDSRFLSAQRDQIAAELAAAQSRLEELLAGPRSEQIEASSARLDRLQAQLELEGIRFARRQQLLAQQATSQEELDVLRFQIQMLEAQEREAQAELDELNNGTRAEQVAAQRAAVSQLQAALRQAELQVEYAELRAPFAATVVARHRDPGAVVTSGEPVFELESIEKEIWVGVPPEVTSLLQVGQRYSLQLGQGVVTGELKSVVSRLDRSTRTQSLIFWKLVPTPEVGSRSLEIPEASRDSASPAVPPLRHPETAGAEIPTGGVARFIIDQPMNSSGFWVPASSLSPGSQGLWAVYVVQDDEDGSPQVRRRDVELLHLAEEAAFVRGTLRSGERLIVAGVHRLTPGQPVQPEAIEWEPRSHRVSLDLPAAVGDRK